MNKSAEFFEKFLELGSVAKVAKHFGVSRQNVHQYLIKLPEYQSYRATPPPAAPSCPKCESDRTVNNGRAKTKKQYLCRGCGFHWEESPDVVKTVYPSIGKPN